MYLEYIDEIRCTKADVKIAEEQRAPLTSETGLVQWITLECFLAPERVFFVYGNCKVSWKLRE